MMVGTNFWTVLLMIFKLASHVTHINLKWKSLGMFMFVYTLSLHRTCKLFKAFKYNI